MEYRDRKVLELRDIAENHMERCKVNSDSYLAWYNIFCECKYNKTLEEIQTRLQETIQVGSSRVGKRITTTRKNIYNSVINGREVK